MTETLKDRLDRLSEAATKGQWCQFGLSAGPFQEQAREAYRKKELHKIDSSHQMSAMLPNGEPYRLAEWTHAKNAEFAESLVNAYRSGQLVTLDDPKVAGLVEVLRYYGEGTGDMGEKARSAVAEFEEGKADE